MHAVHVSYSVHDSVLISCKSRSSNLIYITHTCLEEDCQSDRLGTESLKTTNRPSRKHIYIYKITGDIDSINQQR